MNKLYTLAIFFLLLPLLSFSQTKQERKEAIAKRDKYLFAARPAQKNFTHTIPYISPRDQVVIQVVIAGETYHFLFDTGAATVISTRLKDKLGLQPVTSNKLADGAGQVQEENVYNVGSLQLGPVTFTNVAAVAINLDKFEKLFCMRFDGIFGTNIMRTCNWKIDYVMKTLTFSDKRIKPGTGMREIDFTENFSGSPMLTQVVGEYRYSSIMDTGYNGGFSIPDSLFFKSRKSKMLRFKKGQGNSALTLFDSKPADEYIVVMDSVYIGNYFMKNQRAMVAGGNMALTGNEIFKKLGTVILDWDKHKIYVPDVMPAETTGHLTFGFNPVFVEDTLMVGLVWDDSDAKRQGIETGDTILMINGLAGKDMPQEKWCGLLKIFIDDTSSQKALELLIGKKDGTQRKITVAKFNILAQ